MLSELHATVAGDGEPLVLLHSGGMSSRQWRRLSDRLAPSYRVVAPDFLGSGANPPWDRGKPFDHVLDVEAVEALLDGLGAPAHLVGHSYGGLVALTIARRGKSALRSVAVYDPVAFGVLREPRDEAGLADLARAESDPIFTDDAQGGGDAWYQAFVDFWNGPGAWRALPTPTREAFLRVGWKVYLEVRSLMRDTTPVSAYASIQVPALLMHGARSPIAAQRVVAILAGAIPRATLRAIEGAGHMGPITHEAAVERALLDHLATAR